jgi:lysyl-tRNA synthetase class 2
MDIDIGQYFAEDRLDNMEDLREQGVDPYPHEFNRDTEISDFVYEYADIDEIDSDKEYTLSGRIVGTIRDMGGVTFIDIDDNTGKVQLLLRDDETDRYELRESLDRGDIIEATGTATRTQTGELSLLTSDITVLTKGLNHPPSKDGLSEREKIRNRSVAMQYTGLGDKIEERFKMTSEIRNFLDSEGFLEVETPVLQNIAGGTDAEPFETYSEGKDEDMYLRIATELHLKRMIIGGFDSIYEIGKTFRNEDIDTTHNPEFTSLELYKMYADYEDMMNITEDLFLHLLDEIKGGDRKIEYGDIEIDMSTPWQRLTIEEAISEYSADAIHKYQEDDDIMEIYKKVKRQDGSIEVDDLSDEEIRDMAVNMGADFTGGFSRGLGIQEIFEELVEEEITDPTFIIDHPSESTPLCKEHREKEDRIERFELFIAGYEFANSYTELNNPIEQLEGFAEQMERREEGDPEAHRMDKDFVKSLSYGMPPTGGLGIGVDRLAMLLTDSQSIKEVLPFPMVSQKD